MRTHRSAAVVVVALVLLAGACTSSRYGALPAPPTTVQLPASSTTPDFSGVSLHGVSGHTTTTVVPIGPGTATLNGTVTGPDGVEPGSVVHIERLVGTSVGAMDLPINPDGTWSLPKILGGRYRVRAWRAPDMALVAPAVFFLGTSESKSVSLPLSLYDGRSVSSAVAPSPPVIGHPSNLVVELVVQSVDGSGIVRGAPVVGATLQLAGTGDWKVRSENPVLTDQNGQAAWQVVCNSTGPQPLAVQSDSQAYALQLPECVDFLIVPDTSSTTVRSSATTQRRTTTTH